MTACDTLVQLVCHTPVAEQPQQHHGARARSVGRRVFNAAPVLT
eukprot:COSAG01_NODE_54425_length_332_cov_0.656652_1_plen_43_part_10